MFANKYLLEEILLQDAIKTIFCDGIITCSNKLFLPNDAIRCNGFCQVT